MSRRTPVPRERTATREPPAIGEDAEPSFREGPALPVVVIAGRPNVGKSTLFNRLAGKRAALVADTPGVTRDRKEAEAMLRGRNVRLIDTAGLEESAPDTLAGRMRASSSAAVNIADLVVFVIDARDGITPADAHFAAWLRRQDRKVLLVANKVEGRAANSSVLDAYSLGLGSPLAISAEHGEGISQLMMEIADRLPPEPKPGDDDDAFGSGAPDHPLKLAIVGRPNAGKSTLLNRLLGEDRMITGPEPGLTRDAVASILTDAQGRRIELVDTAGLRRRARIEEPLEKMSVSASLEALKMAEVVVLTIDAVLGLHDQDLQIAKLVEREGRACVIALNKWDAVVDRNATRKAISDRLETSMAQMKGIPVVTFSAQTGANIDKLMPAVWKVYGTWNTRIPTGELNRWFEDALSRHQAPLVSGRRLKLRYITQAKARPPTFVAFGTRAEQMPEDYQRYLVNSLRDTFDLPGTPIRLQLRGTKNPFAES
jgi:GTP-binding protein